MKTPRQALFLLLAVTLVLGSVLGSTGHTGPAVCNKEQRLSVTLMNIELIGLSLCEVGSP